jgi:DNA-directed RNA polymerase subunit RPC12/RpoP
MTKLELCENCGSRDMMKLAPKDIATGFEEIELERS